MRRFWLLSVVLSLIPVTALANAPDFTDIRIFEGQLQDGGWKQSHLRIHVYDGTPNEESPFDSYLCSDLGSGDCGYAAGKKFNLFGTVVYPTCVTSEDRICIEKFELRKDSSTWEEVEYVRSVVAPTRRAEPSIGFPDAGSISLWRSKSVSHQGGGRDYAIYVASEGTVDRTGLWTSSSIQAQIVPFVGSVGSFRESSLVPTEVFVSERAGYRKRIKTVLFEGGSVWSDRFGKGVRAEWSQGVAARLTLRVPSSASGWIGGRVSDVDFDLMPIDENTNRLRITGSPISVSEVNVRIPNADLPEAFKKEWPQLYGGYNLTGSLYGRSARTLDALREYTKDQATRTRTVWGFETVVTSSNICLADGKRILGFVSTNALAYQNSAPSFEDGRLKYAVASMHRNEKGEVIQGSYDLVLRSDAARCLYGFSNAPIEAVVSVTYGDKEENISTTASGERDGWLFISAKNFTFSNPTIEVAISQPKPTPTPTASATPTPTPTVVATPNKVVKPGSKKTISCVKGSAVKKVTGKAPKCPKGFKKRA
jgi:hypothetical protein